VDQAFAVDCGTVLDNLNKLVEDLRRISRDLTPSILADLGLEAALQRLLIEFGQYYQITVHPPGDFTGLNQAFLPGDQIHIYRIFQECLTNIGKHSGAGSLLASIAWGEREVSFMLVDDGMGFNLQEVQKSRTISKGMGLATLQERARLLGGTLSIFSEPKSGTRTHLILPVTSRDKAENLDCGGQGCCIISG
jgi:signal transduction histidine kinase